MCCEARGLPAIILLSLSLAMQGETVAETGVPVLHKRIMAVKKVLAVP